VDDTVDKPRLVTCEAASRSDSSVKGKTTEDSSTGIAVGVVIGVVVVVGIIVAVVVAVVCSNLKKTKVVAPLRASAPVKVNINVRKNKYKNTRPLSEDDQLSGPPSTSVSGEV